MKNKNTKFILIFFIINLIVSRSSFSSSVEFEAEEIIFDKNLNLTLAKNGKAISKKDNIEILGKIFKYYRDDFLLLVENVNLIDMKKKREISSEKLKYSTEVSNLIFEDSVLINDIQNQIEIKTNFLEYNLLKKKLSSDQKTTIVDKSKNNIIAERFSFFPDQKTIYLYSVKVKDTENNEYFFEEALLELSNNKLLAKNPSINFNNPSSNDNEPRLKGLSLEISENETKIKKGALTFCKRRNGCPPWEIHAEEIKHDKIDKTIFYENASLKIYDKKVAYFPKFFHPDPTVKRRTGFLIPEFNENNNKGLSFSLPYFIALKENEDITLTPRLFADNKLLLQSELRKVNSDSNHTIDFSHFHSKDENSKNHFFYDYSKTINSENFDEVNLDITTQQVIGDTYLKTYDLKSPLISNFSRLNNAINLNFYRNDMYIENKFEVYEDLNKKKNDRFEFIPSINLVKNINDNLDFSSSTIFKKYNTNISEKILINQLNYISDIKYFNNGLNNNNQVILKNIATDAENSSNYKNNSSAEIHPIIQTNYLYPLQKISDENISNLTPKVSLRASIPKNKDIRGKERIINLDNIYDINRLGYADVTEGGISMTYGFDYNLKNNINNFNTLNFGIANNLRFKKNNDLPASSNLGKKTSDVVGNIEYNFNNKFKTSYDYSLKNDLTTKNYELFGFEFYLRNLENRIEYMNQNNSNSKNSYLTNITTLNLGQNNFLEYKTSENKERKFTEYHNIAYRYRNDCLVAGIEYQKDFYSDRDLKPNENLFFKITIMPFGSVNSPNIR